MNTPAMTGPDRSRASRFAVLGAVLTALAFSGVAGGCGPVQSTAGISEAEASVERARVQDAEQYSPYEYERARHYLYKAKEEWGYSNFEAARDYAQEARREADAALDNTTEAPWQGHPVHGYEDWPEEIEQLQRRLEEADDIDAVDEVQELDDSGASDDEDREPADSGASDDEDQEPDDPGASDDEDQ